MPVDPATQDAADQAKSPENNKVRVSDGPVSQLAEHLLGTVPVVSLSVVSCLVSD